MRAYLLAVAFFLLTFVGGDSFLLGTRDFPIIPASAQSQCPPCGAGCAAMGVTVFGSTYLDQCYGSIPPNGETCQGTARWFHMDSYSLSARDELVTTRVVDII